MPSSKKRPKRRSFADRMQYRAAAAMAFLPEGAKLRLAGHREQPAEGGRLDPGLALVLRSMEATGTAVLSGDGVGPEQMRANAAASARIFGRPMTEVGSVRDLWVDGAGEPLEARHYRPAPGDDSRPGLLVFAHGGGYVVGSLDTHDEACRLLCRHAGVQVLSVAYRLAPEHRFPAGVEDFTAALRWALATAEELGADPERVAVGGDSAGGNLSAVASQVICASDERRPALQVLIYPGVDFTEDYASYTTFGEGFFLTAADLSAYTDFYLPEGLDRADPRLSPLRADDLGGLPPAIVLTASFDPLRDEGEAYAAALAAAGVPTVAWRAQGLIHGFINMTNVNRASRDAVITLAGMVRAALARG